MVNCWQGASRSATVVLAFLMQHHDMDLMTALKMVKTKRDIRPNNGFLKQLVLLENTLLNGRFTFIINTLLIILSLNSLRYQWKPNKSTL